MKQVTASPIDLANSFTRTWSHRFHLHQELCMTVFNKILVPIDGSDTSDKAMRTALDLTRDALGTVRFVHVIDDALGTVRFVHVIDDDRHLTSYELSGDLRTYAHNNARELLQKAMDAASAMGVKAESHVVDKPYQRMGESVANEAADWGADLVVIGTHGRRGLGRLLLGSGAEQVLRLSGVPVLVVRGP
jgi:nucleotide-binding universal stress UspA family protein